MNSSYFQSPEFRRTSGNIADSGIKFFFKWIEIGIKATANAIKALIMALIGK